CLSTNTEDSSVPQHNKKNLSRAFVSRRRGLLAGADKTALPSACTPCPGVRTRFGGRKPEIFAVNCSRVECVGGASSDETSNVTAAANEGGAWGVRGGRSALRDPARARGRGAAAGKRARPALARVPAAGLAARPRGGDRRARARGEAAGTGGGAAGARQCLVGLGLRRLGVTPGRRGTHGAAGDCPLPDRTR